MLITVSVYGSTSIVNHIIGIFSITQQQSVSISRMQIGAILSQPINIVCGFAASFNVQEAMVFCCGQLLPIHFLSLDR